VQRLRQEGLIALSTSCAIKTSLRAGFFMGVQLRKWGNSHFDQASVLRLSLGKVGDAGASGLGFVVTGLPFLG
jgi:hypothetical protein